MYWSYNLRRLFWPDSGKLGATDQAANRRGQVWPPNARISDQVESFEAAGQRLP
jgi:hypothetical protein